MHTFASEIDSVSERLTGCGVSLRTNTSIVFKNNNFRAYDRINEITRRVLRGDSRISNLDEELGGGYRTEAHIAASIISGLFERRIAQRKDARGERGGDVQLQRGEATLQLPIVFDDAGVKQRVMALTKKTEAGVES